MTEIAVKGQNPYPILIESGGIAACGEHIRSLLPPCRALIISDSHVAPVFGETVRQSLTHAGFEAGLYTFPAGEPNKTLATVEQMLFAMGEHQLTRSDLVVALGGGVTGDLAGFAAAIYLRGIDFVQIPTTLLAQIDSSVGGKTGCDLPFGKNLAGAFHNPRLVLIDPDTLSTLPERYLRDGMGEAVKYGCIFDEALFEKIGNKNYVNFLPELIARCVTLKRDVVEEDFREKGRRTLLNFGHTVGHAIERVQNYSGFSHGEAVSVGMVLMTRAAEAHGLCKNGEAERIVRVLEKIGLPVSCEMDIPALAAAAVHDKKTHGSQVKLVLLRQIGDSFTYDLPAEKLTEFLSGGQL